MLIDTTPDPDDAAAKMLADVDGAIARTINDKAAEPAATLSQWVVLAEGAMPLRFDIDPAGNVTNPRTCRMPEATRFNARTAHHVADKTQNGKGTKGQALRLLDAYDAVLHNLATVQAFLRQAIANKSTVKGDQ